MVSKIMTSNYTIVEPSAELIEPPDSTNYLEFLERCEDVAWICYICNLRIPKDKVSLDHIIPILNGGANHIDNILPTHRGCNFAKMNYSVKEVLSWRSA
ncbi:hypothetical protein LCGC14_2611870 [marine sediment metagenome]|uniref:HNH endonuclease 5 domain-containing protein n=1 Tax=marine sediment metagenome TaxID=412755 RepID=A0A0F9A5W0_9ZZZZ